MAEVIAVVVGHLAEFLAEAAITYFGLQASHVKGARQKVESIKSKLEKLKSILKYADREDARDEIVKQWVRDVRDASFKLVDILDNHAYAILRNYETSPTVRGIVKRCWKILPLLAAFRRTSIELDIIMPSVMKIENVYNEAIESRIALMLQNDSPTTEEPSPSERRSFAYNGFRNDDVFLSSNGFTPKDLEDLILNNPPDGTDISDCRSMIISVCGMPGVGKTTLVQKVFHSLATKFRYAVWVTVGQSFKIEDVKNRLFNRMEKNAKKNNITDSGNNEHDVDIDGMDREHLDRLADELNRQPCLIVFDDIWQADFWEKIKPVFRRDHHPNSRILVTTRHRVIASSLAQESRMIELNTLQEKEAWRLFCINAFWRDRENKCPDNLIEFAEKIVRKCGGLPLAIKAAGGMMSTKGQEIGTWERSCNTLMSDLGNDSMNSILTHSYYDLGPHLKPCFLYCGTYPEDYTFGKEDIIRLWIAEGFVEQENDTRNTLEEEAEEYLQDLIERGLFQVAERAETGEIITCRTHDVIRNMALKLSSEQRFSVLLDDNVERRNLEDAHRLSVLPNAERFPSETNLASLRSFSLFRRDYLTTTNFSSLNFKLLKVLMLRGSSISSFPDEILSLYLLRFLSLSYTRIRVEEIPRKIKRLRHLQTFELWNTNIKRLPRSIVKLKQLRHLMFDGSYGRGFEAPDGIWDLENLQTLKHVNASKDLVEHIGKLTKLRALWISKVEQTQVQSLLNSLGRTPYLRELTIRMANGCSINLQILDTPPRHLQFLSMIGNLTSIPTWFTALTKLKQLLLNNSCLREDPCGILGSLPSLAVLSMNNAYEGSKLNFSDSSFPNLKVLHISDLGKLTSIKIATSALPELRKLQICKCLLLEKPVSLANDLEKLEEYTLQGIFSQAAGDFGELGMRSSNLTLKWINGPSFTVYPNTPSHDIQMADDSAA